MSYRIATLKYLPTTDISIKYYVYIRCIIESRENSRALLTQRHVIVDNDQGKESMSHPFWPYR